MKDKAYDYMDWPGIEGILYSDEKNPKSVLAPRVVKEGVLYQSFFPGAKKANLKISGVKKIYPMAKEDESGYFACLVPGKKVQPHSFVFDGKEAGDPYAFENVISEEEENRFQAGIFYDAYRKLGSHVMELGGQKGIFFSVWAPNAIRVSVVGDFCSWDGRRFPMEYHESSGLYELFIPFLSENLLYGYEMKLSDGLTYTRPDPYAFAFQKNDRWNSMTAELSYHWHDREYLAERRKKGSRTNEAVSIFECSLAAYGGLKEGESRNYRNLADEIIGYASSMGYTHIELLPVMEYPDEASNGFHTGGYFAPTSRYGSPADFKYLIDKAHECGIGVLLVWTPAQFTPDSEWLAAYDGTCLYEHLNPLQGIHPLWGTKIFNYARPAVKNFLTSSALFWMKEYHADGLMLDGCSSILRLDYGRAPGQWIPNIYGTYENLDGIEFLKHLNSTFKKNFPDGLLIMEEDTDWPEVTGSGDDGCLGFDYKWNLHFTQDMLHYLSLSSEDRKHSHDLLMMGMLHNYLEHFILSLSRGIGLFNPEKFRQGIAENNEKKDALLRCAYCYLFAHPGKKLLTEGESFDNEFFSSLLRVYRNEPSFFSLDYDENGFEWINTMDDCHCILTFLRKTDNMKDTILAVFNFSDETFESYKVGVPFAGRYKEIFNSDSISFGGNGFVNPRAKSSRKAECDERENSIMLRLAPLSAAFFRYQA